MSETGIEVQGTVENTDDGYLALLKRFMNIRAALAILTGAAAIYLRRADLINGDQVTMLCMTAFSGFSLLEVSQMFADRMRK